MLPTSTKRLTVSMWPLASLHRGHVPHKGGGVFEVFRRAVGASAVVVHRIGQGLTPFHDYL